MRVPDDPNHGLLLPKSTGRIRAGLGVFARNRGAVLPAGAGSGGRGRTLWSGPVGFESVGEWIHRDRVWRVRVEPVGGFRDYASIEPSDQPRQGIPAWGLFRNAAHGPDVFTDVVRLRGAVRRQFAGCIRASQGRSAGAGNGEFRHRLGLAVLLP